MEINYTCWTDEMNAFLKTEYQWVGDTRLAEIFEEKFPKQFKWTKRHIERRRVYMGLKRTKEQEHCLRVVANLDGRYKMWDVRGRFADESLVDWGGRKYIKVKGKFVPHARYVTGAKPGEVVRTFEGCFKVIDRRENQRLNAERRSHMTPEIKETVKTLNQLKKLIWQKR